jgi:putative transposase
MPYDSLDPPRRSRSNPKESSQSTAYFVTLVVRERACILAEVLEDDLRLTELGQIVQEEWFKTSLLKPQLKVSESEFVVMPNHIHGLIRIVADDSAKVIQPGLAPTFEQFNRPPSNSLPSFMRAFKAAVNNRLSPPPQTPGLAFWERGYDEQLIRSEAILKRTRQRIQINPFRWTTDPLHPDFPSLTSH